MNHKLTLYSYGKEAGIFNGTKAECEKELKRVVTPDADVTFVNLGNGQYYRPKAITSFQILDNIKDNKQEEVK